MLTTRIRSWFIELLLQTRQAAGLHQGMSVKLRVSGAGLLLWSTAQNSLPGPTPAHVLHWIFSMWPSKSTFCLFLLFTVTSKDCTTHFLWCLAPVAPGQLEEPEVTWGCRESEEGVLILEAQPTPFIHCSHQFCPVWAPLLLTLGVRMTSCFCWSWGSAIPDGSSLTLCKWVLQGALVSHRLWASLGLPVGLSPMPRSSFHALCLQLIATGSYPVKVSAFGEHRGW